jgi:hypothetical protein
MESNYPFSTGRSSLLGTEAFRNLLGTSLKNAKKSVIILSAYVTEIGMKWVQEQITNNNVKCTIIARWDKSDLAQGSSDLVCYHLAKEKNWDFKILNNLHAKIMLIDNKDLFIGSPNLTGHGMNLVPAPNKEIGVKLEATISDISIIKNLVEDSISINDDFYEHLVSWKNSIPEVEKILYPEFPKLVKDKLYENFNKIWVHNFPWSSAEDLINKTELNDDILHDIELFGLDKNNLNKNLIKNSFINSKVYYWLISQIKKQENKEIYFGNLSSIIHNSLLDDPKPYRKDIKILQANLYSFIKIFLNDEIKIDIPYEKSERLKLKNIN